MNIELEEKLSRKYPLLYGNDPIPMEFECGDGWYELIDDLSKSIEEYNKKHKKNPVVASQVKEKFGGLRFYVDRSKPAIDELIRDAEARSYHVCELCGTKQDVETSPYKGGYWIKSVCKKCRG